MSTRLQFLLNDEELEELKERARRENMTVFEWVRRELRHEMRDRPAEGARKNLEMIRRHARYEFPSGDYEEIAAEIESRYRGEQEL